MPVGRDDIIRYAATEIEEGKRLDLGVLAGELHISRVTLFRRVGNRDQLLSEALWWLNERSLESSIGRWRCANGDAVRGEGGALRSMWIVTDHCARTGRDTGFQKLLDDEPIAAIRALTDPEGAVQPRMITAITDLLERDVRDGGLRPSVDLGTLAFAVVRLGESVLYADLLAGRQSNIAKASTLVTALVEGVLRTE
ncbi:QsdR family transcriptional regulator [Nocardia lijiangensis]|uniref:QsdR family transcriptional regulator n=1 Tax=Nocardia lijiangensis TaxID=299618 RepID=UPI0008330C14|nr:QsdR family transcriptional regulator [Nocardia lijiangensis]